MKVEAVDALKVAPPAYLSAYAAGWTINEWAAAAAFVYSVLLCGQLIYKWVVAWRTKRKAP